MILRRALKPCLIHRRFAPDQRPARGPDGQADPIVGIVPLAVFLGQLLPAAIFGAKILSDIRNIDQLVLIDMRRFIKPDDHIRPRAGIGRHAGLLADILPADEIHPHLHPRGGGEARGIGAEHILIGLHKAHRAQHAQGGATFQRQARGGDIGRHNIALRHGLAGHKACAQAADKPACNAECHVSLSLSGG